MKGDTEMKTKMKMVKARVLPRTKLRKIGGKELVEAGTIVTMPEARWKAIGDQFEKVGEYWEWEDELVPEPLADVGGGDGDDDSDDDDGAAGGADDDDGAAGEGDGGGDDDGDGDTDTDTTHATDFSFVDDMHWTGVRTLVESMESISDVQALLAHEKSSKSRQVVIKDAKKRLSQLQE